jgi:uncharacterized protein (TIGR02996 family)
MTPEEEAFLADIAEHPEDDSLRLIYADWLEDSGQVERAAFIRVQCELARLPRDDPRRRELKTRERELQEKHERGWVAPLLDFVEDWGFQRGVVVAVTFDRSDLRAILGSPSLACVRDIALALPRLPLAPPSRADAACEALVQSPLLSRLFRFAIRRCVIGLPGLRALAHARLQDLTLDDCDIGDEGVRALTQSGFWPNLARLDLARNPLDDAGALELLAAPWPARLAFLGLVDCDIGEPLQQALREHYGESVCRFE